MGRNNHVHTAVYRFWNITICLVYELKQSLSSITTVETMQLTYDVLLFC